MKKLIVIALAVVMTFAVVAFAACAKEETVTGECSYDSYGHTYGVKVDVTVKGGVITAVKLYKDSETGWVRTSDNNADRGWLVHDEVEAAYEGWIEKEIIGKTVDEVNAWEAAATADGQTVTKGPILKLTTGETAQQSSARIIVAVQNALSKIGK